MQLPATIPAALAAHPVLHQGLWDTLIALPAPIDAALIAGAISLPLGAISLLLGIMNLFTSRRSLAVAREAKDIAQQKLFADLIKPRLEWRSGFKVAVETRKTEILNAHQNTNNPYATPGAFPSNPLSSPGLDLLEDRKIEAHSFFDKTITTLVNDVVKELEVQALAKTANLNNKTAATSSRLSFHKTDQLRRDTMSALKPFLYVGHIKQDMDDAKPGVRIAGMFER